MGEFSEKIRRLTEVMGSISSLQGEIDELTKPVLEDLSKIPHIYDIYSSMRAEKTMNDGDFKKYFTMLVVMLYAPKSIVDGKLFAGLRGAISKELGYSAETAVSNNLNVVRFWYRSHKGTREYIDNTYREIVENLKIRGLAG